MASNNELLNDIKKNVKSINTNTKHFGTKMPSDGDLEKEMDEQELTYSQMIMGSLASLVWGKLNVKDEDKVKSLLGSKNNIYNLIEDLKNDIEESIILIGDTIETYFKKFDKTLQYIDAGQNDIKNLYEIINKLNTQTPTSSSISEDSIEKIIKAIESNKQKIEISIVGDEKVKYITELISQLEKFNIDDKKYINSLNGLYELINKLGSKDLKVDIQKVQENLKTLKNDILGTVNDEGELTKEGGKSLAAIFKSLEVITKDLNISNNVDNLSVILDDIIKALTIDVKNVNLKGLYYLLKITDKDKGEIKTLIENLEKISGTININEKNIIALGSFFESLSKVGDIGLIKRYKIKSNIKYFAKFIGKDIPKIFKELTRVSGDSKSADTIEAMTSLIDFFNNLIKIGDLTKTQKHDIVNNLEFINDELIDLLFSEDKYEMGIFPKLFDAVKSYEEKTSEVLKGMQSLFDIILGINKISFKDLLKLEIKLEYLNEIISSEIIGDDDHKEALLYTLKNIQVTEDIEHNLSSLISILDLFTVLSTNLPSLKQLLIDSIKLGMLSGIELPLIIFIANKFSSLNIKDEIVNNKVKSVLLMINGFRLIGEELIKQIRKIEKKDIESIQNIIKIVNTINDNIKKWSKYDSKDAEKIKTFYEDTLKIIVDNFKDIAEPIKKISISNADIDKATKCVMLINTLSKIAVSSLAIRLGKGGMKAMLNVASKIAKIIERFKKINKKDINKAILAINSFQKLIFTSAAILLFGALVMSQVKVADLILFAATLSGFMFAMGLTFKLVSKGFRNKMKGAKDAMKLIVAGGLIMGLGARLIHNINISDLFKFAVTLSTFLFGVGLALLVTGKAFRKTFKAAKNAALLVTTLAAVMLFGSYFIKHLDEKELLKFTVTLGAFLFAIGLSLRIISLKRALKGAKRAMKLVLFCAGLMFFGAWAIKYLDTKALFTFVITFASFLFAIAGTLFIIGLAVKHLHKTIKSITNLLIVSTVILLIGAWFMQDNKRVKAAIQFAILLAGFLFAITLSFKLASKGLVTTILTAIALIAIMTISTVLLLVGAWFILNDPRLAIAAIVFTAVLGLFITGVINAVKIAGRGLKHLIKGAIAILAIIGLVYLMGKAFQEVVKVSNMVDNWIALIATIGLMGGVIAALYWAAYSIGALGSSALGYIAIGEAILAGLVGIIWLMGKAISSIAEGLKDIAIASKYSVDFGNLAKLLGGFVLLIPAMIGLSTASPFILVGAAAMKALRSFLSDAADIVVAWSSLKIPIYEGTKVIGYKILTKEDFTNASDNIKSTITCLFQTISDIYDANPDMFDFSLTSLLTGSGGTKFGKVARAGTAMSVMLSKMAEAIDLWSKLKIPVYEGTTIVDYHTIEHDDFVKAAEHIKEVVKCLSQAIIDVYNENPDMFADDWILGPKSAFTRVTNRLGPMSQVLGAIANCVKEWAALTIPVYEGAEVKTYITIEKKEFVNAAEHIKEVVKCLSQAIIDVYNENPDMFADDWILGPKSAFTRVTNRLGPMAEVLGAIANCVKEWAALTIPVYEGAEVKTYITITNQDFVKAGDHVKEVVKCLSQAIVDVYNENPDMFADDWILGPKSPFTRVTNRLGPMANVLSAIADAVKNWADLKIPVYKAGSTEIETYKTLVDKDFVTAGEHVKEVVKCLSQAIVDVYNENPDMFADDWLIGTKSPFTKVTNRLGPMADVLEKIADAVKNWSELKIPVYKKGTIEIETYRTLTEDDFVNASANIGKVVSCLSQAIIDIYNNNNGEDGMFSDTWFTASPFTKVTNRLGPMGEVLCTIGDAIQKWAELKMPIYKPGTIEIETYRTLNDDDFVKASENIGKVVTCLSQAIINIYNEHKGDGDMFGDTWFTASPFTKVTNRLGPMGNMLATIGDAIEKWADLKIPVYGPNSADILTYKTLKDGDFVEASRNIGKVVSCLAQAIIDIYEDNSDEGEMFWDGWLDDEKSPFVRVVNQLTPIGHMLSCIADGIKDWADLKIPVYKANSPEILTYKTIVDDDFVRANENIGKVVKCLAQAIVDVYEDNPYMFDSKNPIFSHVIDALMPMGDVLLTIGDSIKAWADLKIPVYKRTEIIGYKTIESSDFVQASRNIGEVVKCLSQAIVDVYYDNPLMFIDFEKSDSPFSKVMKSVKPMGEFLADLGEAIKDWSELKIPIYKLNSTEISTYKTISDKEFVQASKNIGKVVTFLVETIGGLYDQHPDWFVEIESETSKVGMVLSTIKPLGNTLKEIAEGVQGWADLRIPIYGQNNDGEATVIGYKTLQDKEFTAAAKNIGRVTTFLVSTIAGLYTKHPDYFDIENGDSKVTKVLNTIEPLGNTIGTIAKGVQDWTDLKIPIYDRNEKGEAIISDYVTLTDGDFVQAGINICKVVTYLVTTLGFLYDRHQQDGWFDDNQKGNSKISKVLKSIEPIGNTIAAIGEGVKFWSELALPVYGKNSKGELAIVDYKTLEDQDFVDASFNICKVVTFLVESIGELYDNHKEDGWFDGKLYDDSKVGKVLKAIEPLGTLVASLGEGIKNWVDLKIPVYGHNQNGELVIKDYVTLNKSAFKKAKEHIGETIITLGNAICDVVKQNPEIFEKEDNPVRTAAESIKITADTLSSIATVIGYYASGKFPTMKYDKNGKLIPGGTIYVGTKTLDDMKARMTSVLTALGSAIISIYEDPANKDIWEQIEDGEFKKDAPAMIVANSVATIADALMKTIEVITKIVELNMNDLYKKLTEKDFANGFKSVVDVLMSLYAVIGDDEMLHNIALGEDNILKVVQDSFTNYVSEKSMKLKSTIKIFKNLPKQIQTVFEGVSEMIKTYDKHKRAIKRFINEDVDGTVLKIKLISESLASSIEELSEININDDLIVKSINNIELLSQEFDQIKASVEAIVNNSIELNKLNSKVKDIEFNNIETTIKKLINCISSINKELEIFENGQSILSNNLNGFTANLNNKMKDGLSHLLKDIDDMEIIINKIVQIAKTANTIDASSFVIISNGIKELNYAFNSITFENKTNADNFLNELKFYINILENIKDIDSLNDKTNILKNGIIGIYHAICEVQDNEKFKQHTESLQKYIDVINSIDLSRINSLKGFVEAMNQLSMRLGNLDNLTDAIANKLSAVLLELVNQLRLADSSIKNAHKLQEYRKKLIDESVETVKKLMADPMIVEISQKSENDQEDEFNSGDIDKKSTGGGTAQEVSNEKEEGLKLDNPEKSTSNKLKFDPQYNGNNNSDILTKSEFENLMKRNLKGWGEN